MSKYKVGDRVSVRGAVGTVEYYQSHGNYRYVVSVGGIAEWYAEEELTSYPFTDLLPKTPFTVEQVEFLRDLWWNEPAGTDSERILGELLKLRV